jgi:hypothetical protein
MARTPVIATKRLTSPGMPESARLVDSAGEGPGAQQFWVQRDPVDLRHADPYAWPRRPGDGVEARTMNRDGDHAVSAFARNVKPLGDLRCQKRQDPTEIASENLFT